MGIVDAEKGRPLRIAMIGQKGYPAFWGGVERHVDSLAGCLCGRGHDVTVFVRPYYQRQRREQRQKRGARSCSVKVRRIPSLHTKHLDAITHTALSTLCAGKGFDVLHYHCIGPGSMAALSKVLYPSSARVLTVHALDWRRAKWKSAATYALRGCEQVAVRHADRVISVSETIRSYLKEHYGVASHLIPNGLARGKRLGAGAFLAGHGLERKRYFLFLARLEPEKGAHLLLDAFRSGSVGAGWKLVIAGPGQGTSYTKELKRRIGRDRNVVVPGAVFGDALCELYSNAGVFVLPSLLEGCSITFLEALSYDLPVVASALPSIQEEAGRVGAEGRVFQFKTGDVPALAGCMKQAAEHSMQPGREGGDAAREKGFSAMSWPEVTGEVEKVYYRALA